MLRASSCSRPAPVSQASECGHEDLHEDLQELLVARQGGRLWVADRRPCACETLGIAVSVCWLLGFAARLFVSLMHGTMMVSPIGVNE